MKTSITDTPPVIGPNIFLDERGRDILFDKRTNSGYVITNKDASKLTVFQNRYAIALVVGILIYSMFSNLVVSIIVGIVSGIAMEIIYRYKWLPTLTQISNFKPTKKQDSIQALKNKRSKKRLLFTSIFYLTIGVLIVVNGYMMKSSTNELIAYWIILAIALYYSITNLLAYLKH